ncbi:hypothetical protein HMPREF9445_02857 [Bacteroides clarus YIT 12056]|uniref:Uncharacterized protein n=1 Tax=Bacteroides clarus YIT 12056 TaxID=762984 RepID=A0ABP2KP04_9BACE|nr:hypothetical protein HMPREF9445_02857 [Bacteroides clarus YIT 12056]
MVPAVSSVGTEDSNRWYQAYQPLVFPVSAVGTESSTPRANNLDTTLWQTKALFKKLSPCWE